MEELETTLSAWAEDLQDFHLPTWEELPDLELYMDQVVTLVDKYLSPIIQTTKHPLLTAAMVNNYVKKQIMPAPIKKKYNRRHLAYLIAITTLKQVLTINEIQTGILFQGKHSGIRQAYDLFCDEQETAIHLIRSMIHGIPEIKESPIPLELLAVKSATRSFASKLLTEKLIELESELVKVNNK